MVVVCGQHPPRASASAWKGWNRLGPREPCPAWWRPARPVSCAVPSCWKVQVDAAVPDVERAGDVGAGGLDTAESAQHILGGVENRLLGQALDSAPNHFLPPSAPPLWQGCSLRDALHIGEVGPEEVWPSQRKGIFYRRRAYTMQLSSHS